MISCLHHPLWKYQARIKNWSLSHKFYKGLSIYVLKIPPFILLFILNFIDNSSQKGEMKSDYRDIESKIHDNEDNISDDWDEEKMELAFHKSRYFLLF